MISHASSVPLPPPRKEGDLSLEAVLSRRRSVREYLARQLSQEQIGQLLWAACGVTAVELGLELRAAPSAGALYPLEIYVVTPEGVFHYIPRRHELQPLASGDLRPALLRGALEQESIGQAPAVFVITAIYSRTTRKYGRRGAERYVHMEAGHAAQNLLLQATALGLGGVVIGAFEDEAVKNILGLPEAETPLYLIPVGYPRP
jgi:SagB-type dehydrogenase family enzyme